MHRGSLGGPSLPSLFPLGLLFLPPFLRSPLYICQLFFPAFDSTERTNANAADPSVRPSVRRVVGCALSGALSRVGGQKVDGPLPSLPARSPPPSLRPGGTLFSAVASFMAGMGAGYLG